MFSCKEDDYFYNATDETVSMSMWTYLESEPSHSYFMELVSKYNIDTLIADNNPTTLFIPSDEMLMQLDTTVINIKRMLNYLVVPTLVNVQSFSTSNKVQTRSLKFALIEYDSQKSTYAYDGVSIVNTSPLYTNGRFYELEEVVLPAPNLYEYISQTSAVFKNFIDLQDSVYFDIDASDPIGFGVGGTTYDSIFSSLNLFYKNYFPVEEEFRNTTATFTLFTQDQFDAALEVMKTDLGTDIIPEVWQNEILLPTLVSNSIFRNSLQYDEFSENMVNVNGDSIIVSVDNILADSRNICSNGVVFTLSDFVIPDSLYKAQSVIVGQEQVVEVIAGEDWLWSSDVTIEGLYALEVFPQLIELTSAENENVLAVDLSAIPDDTLRFTFVQKGVFGAEKYRLLWAGSNTLCGQYKIYVNGVALQMRSYKGTSADYFDSFEFSSSVIKSTTGVSGNFKGTGTYNMIDFEVENLTDYSDVEITFEYIGPSKDSRGTVRGVAGLIIDYIKLEMYE